MREKIRASLPFEDFFLRADWKHAGVMTGNEGDLVKKKTLAHPVWASLISQLL